jgi:hypothetical protein
MKCRLERIRNEWWRPDELMWEVLAVFKRATLTVRGRIYRWRKDASTPRRVQAVTESDVIAFPEVGGLHSRYKRRAA